MIKMTKVRRDHTAWRGENKGNYWQISPVQCRQMVDGAPHYLTLSIISFFISPAPLTPVDIYLQRLQPTNSTLNCFFEPGLNQRNLWLDRELEIK